MNFLDKTDLDAINKINGLNKEKSNLKEELSRVKEQFKTAKDQQENIKSDFEINKKESVSVDEWMSLLMKK